MSLEISLKAYRKWNIYSRKSIKAWQGSESLGASQPRPPTNYAPHQSQVMVPPLPLGLRAIQGTLPTQLQTKVTSSWEQRASVASIPTCFPLATCTWGSIPGSEVCDTEVLHGKHQDVHQPSLTRKRTARVPCWKKRVTQIRCPGDGHPPKTGLSSREMTPGSAQPQSGSSEAFRGREGKSPILSLSTHELTLTQQSMKSSFKQLSLRSRADKETVVSLGVSWTIGC